MSQPNASIAQPTSFKARVRSTLGDNAYRIVSQAPRILRMIVKPSYELETAATPLLLKPGMVCFDIGGHYGLFSRFMSPLVGKTGRIYAFEPSALTCGVFRTVKRVCGLSNVEITQCAMADTPGELTLTIPIKAHGGLGTSLAHLGPALDRPGITETVEVKTLDNFVRERGITQCDFIKCDVEGAELLVIKGAAETIARFKPAMMFEIAAAHLKRHNHTVAEIEAVLRGYGYSFYLWRNNGFEPVDGLRDDNIFCLQTVPA